jgi:hypothetical protein
VGAMAASSTNLALIAPMPMSTYRRPSPCVNGTHYFPQAESSVGQPCSLCAWPHRSPLFGPTHAAPSAARLPPYRLGERGCGSSLAQSGPAREARISVQCVPPMDARICMIGHVFLLFTVRVQGHPVMAQGLPPGSKQHSTRQPKEQLTWDQCSGSYLKESCRPRWARMFTV